jgi:hypothetical protein
MRCYFMLNNRSEAVEYLQGASCRPDQESRSQISRTLCRTLRRLSAAARPPTIHGCCLRDAASKVCYTFHVRQSMAATMPEAGSSPRPYLLRTKVSSAPNSTICAAQAHGFFRKSKSPTGKDCARQSTLTSRPMTTQRRFSLCRCLLGTHRGVGIDICARGLSMEEAADAGVYATDAGAPSRLATVNRLVQLGAN